MLCKVCLKPKIENKEEQPIQNYKPLPVGVPTSRPVQQRTPINPADSEEYLDLTLPIKEKENN